MKYIKNLLIAIDQLGNSICGGNPDCTISARVGYRAMRNKDFTRYFWQGLEKVINITFWPVDGYDHCRKSFFADPENIYYDNNSDVMRVVISVIIVTTCIPISILLYIYWVVRRLITVLSILFI